MKYSIVFLIAIPLFSFSQNLEDQLQDKIQKFILRYKVNDVSSYSSIRFSKIDTIFVMSEENQLLKENLIQSQFELFKAFSSDSTNYSDTEYKQDLKEYRKKINQLEQEKKVIEGYTLKHTYRSKNRYDELSIYEGEFHFDTDGKLIESSIVKSSTDSEKGS